MANNENLISIAKRTTSEQREIRSKGGKRSGERRRKIRDMKEWAKIIGSLPAKVVCPDGSELKKADLNADAIMQQYRRAHNGDTKAATFIAKLTGQFVETHEVAMKGSVEFKGFPSIMPPVEGIEDIVKMIDQKRAEENADI